MEAKHRFEDHVENAIAELSNSVPGNFSDAEKKWFALKLFERDEKIQEKLGLDKAGTLDNLQVLIGPAAGPGSRVPVRSGTYWRPDGPARSVG